MNAETDILAKYPMVEAQIFAIRAPFGNVTTDQAIADIKQQFDRLGPYLFAKQNGALVNNSGEEFAIQFMSFYNEFSGTSTY